MLHRSIKDDSYLSPLRTIDDDRIDVQPGRTVSSPSDLTCWYVTRVTLSSRKVNTLSAQIVTKATQ